MGQPLMLLLGRIRVRKFQLPLGARAGITLLSMITLLLLVLSWLIPILGNQINLLRQNAETLSAGIEGSLASLAGLEDMARSYHLVKPDFSIQVWLRDTGLTLLNSVSLSGTLETVAGIAGGIIGAFFSISFITFFFLKESTLLARMILIATPDAYTDRIKNIMQHTRVFLTRYFLGLMLETLLVSILVSLGLWILGIGNAVLIGVLAGVLNIIPYVGPVFSAVLAALFTLLGHPELEFYTLLLPMMGKAVALILVVQWIDNLIVQPLIYASSVKAHPLEIFLVFLAAGTIGGIAGMILAVPAYTVLRVIAREFFSQFKIVQAITRDM
jgi:predicted PurR-regulated permease PerM